LNPAFVIRDWGNANAKLTLNGKAIPRGKEFRYGHRRTLESTDLIVWVRAESQSALRILIEP
jgi:hypothetical protein